MLTKQQVLERVAKINELAKLEDAAISENYDVNDKKACIRWHKKMDAARKRWWKAITDLDRLAGKGLQIGRVLRFPTGDGHALHAVTAIRTQTVETAHLSGGDNWWAQAVDRNGNCLRSVAEQNVGFTDGMAKIFGKKKGKGKAA